MASLRGFIKDTARMLLYFTVRSGFHGFTTGVNLYNEPPKIERLRSFITGAKLYNEPPREASLHGFVTDISRIVLRFTLLRLYYTLHPQGYNRGVNLYNEPSKIARLRGIYGSQTLERAIKRIMSTWFYK